MKNNTKKKGGGTKKRNHVYQPCTTNSIFAIIGAPLFSLLINH